jgi:hypothetical protein
MHSVFFVKPTRKPIPLQQIHSYLKDAKLEGQTYKDKITENNLYLTILQPALFQLHRSRMLNDINFSFVIDHLATILKHTQHLRCPPQYLSELRTLHISSVSSALCEITRLESSEMRNIHLKKLQTLLSEGKLGDILSLSNKLGLQRIEQARTSGKYAEAEHSLRARR